MPVLRSMRLEARMLPAAVVCHHGPALTFSAMLFWSRKTGVTLHGAETGKLTQYAFIESFHEQYHKYFFNLNWFANMGDAHPHIDTWRYH